MLAPPSAHNGNPPSIPIVMRQLSRSVAHPLGIAVLRVPAKPQSLGNLMSQNVLKVSGERTPDNVGPAHVQGGGCFVQGCHHGRRQDKEQGLGRTDVLRKSDFLGSENMRVYLYEIGFQQCRPNYFDGDSEPLSRPFHRLPVFARRRPRPRSLQCLTLGVSARSAEAERPHRSPP